MSRTSLGADPIAPPVLAADAWRSNAELVADVHRLGYLADTDHVIDPTYGRGIWWKAWRPARLTAHDIRTDGTDFRHLPYPANYFDAAAYDPPYVCVGGRQTTGVADLHDRYGLTEAPRSPADLQQLIDDGLTEMVRVVKPKGIVLVKCQDYVSSGRIWPGSHHTLSGAFELGCLLVDRFEHLGGVRPQPPGRRQVHARRNLSTMFVLRTPGTPT